MTMTFIAQWLVVAQLAVAAPDTSLLTAFLLAVDTAAAPAEHQSLRARTIYVDVATFAQEAKLAHVPERPLPEKWKSYHEADLAACLAAPACGGPTTAFVRTHRVDYLADGSLVILGAIHYAELPRARPATTRGIAGTGGARIRQFNVILTRSQSGWKVVRVSVLHAA